LIVVHQGALGDFLLALSVIEGLCLCHPGIRLDFWAKREHIGLIAEKQYVGDVYSIDGPELTPFFHEDLWRSAVIPAPFLRCDAAFIFGQSSSRLASERLSTRLSIPVHWVQSFPHAESGELGSVSRFLAEQVRRLGWKVRKTDPRVVPNEFERSKAREWMLENGWDAFRQPVLIHPGSGGRGKIWPLARWWALLHWMRNECRLPVILTLGPADKPLADFAVAARERLGAVPVADLSLKRLTALLAESRFYLGSDSGVSHLAAAVGIPAGVIFGPTDPGIWAPGGPNVHVLLDHWEPSEVLEWAPHVSIHPPEPRLRALVERLGK
jgi:heptosyltransferase III